MNSFKERLREAIIAKNMSQSELSRLTGIGRNSISDYL
ncbi:helix-turn-helix domain-containing protein, partial [Staphylococcus aureus]